MKFDTLQSMLSLYESSMPSGYSIRVDPKSDEEKTMVRLFMGRKRVGHGIAFKNRYTAYSKMPDAVKKSIQNLGMKGEPEIWCMDNVWIDDVESRGKGLGIEIYVTIVNEVGKRGGVLVSGVSCGGGTSKDAEKVWGSSRFKERVHVDGQVAVSKEFMEKGEDLVKSSKNLITMNNIWATRKGVEHYDEDGVFHTKEEDRINQFRQTMGYLPEVSDEEVEDFIASKVKKRSK